MSRTIYKSIRAKINVYGTENKICLKSILDVYDMFTTNMSTMADTLLRGIGSGLATTMFQQRLRDSWNLGQTNNYITLK